MKRFIVVVDDDPAALDSIERDLRDRYGVQYQILSERSASSALQQLRRLADERAVVALLIADQWMPEMTGIDFFVRAHELHPGAKRLLAIDVGDVTAEGPITRALTLGQLDFYFGKPWATPEEEFYPVSGEALRDWARAHLPRYEKMKIVAEQHSARARQLKSMAERNNIACGVYPVDSSEGRQLLEQHGVGADRLPVVITYSGQVLIDPSSVEIVEAMGAPTEPPPGVYDVTIIGAGPAGLAAAVYGASEGLRTLILEHEAVGGQAGTSPMIHNYLGFPWGVSGRDLTERGGRQATRFGASIAPAYPATRLSVRDGHRVVTLENGTEVTSRTVVIATGVTYRRLGAPGVDALLGAGVFYGADVSEAHAMEGDDVYVVGAGNSAGEAAVHLAAHAARVTLLVRGTSLAKSMSDYLIQEIEATRNMQVRFNTQIAGALGAHHLEGLVLQDVVTGEREEVPAAALFVLIGAVPHTDWLAGTVVRDGRGFIETGRDLIHDGALPEQWPLQRAPLPLETSIPGVFAAGDVRQGSMKRVAAAVGEGSTAIQLVREYLSEQ